MRQRLAGVAVVVAFLGGLYWLTLDYRTQATDLLKTELGSVNHPVEVFWVDGRVSSVREAFDQAGKPFFMEDRVTMFPDIALGFGSVIRVERSLPIVIQDGQTVHKVRTWASSVSDVLSENQLYLGSDDRITPPLETSLSPNLRLTITRVSKSIVTERETISFQTIERETESLSRGETQVESQGAAGERVKEYQVVRENGQIVSKILVSNVVSRQPVNRVVLRGTRVTVGRVITGPLTHYGGPTRAAIAMRLGWRRGTQIRVTNLETGRSLITRVDDVCACNIEAHAVLDLREDYFARLAPLWVGVVRVKVEEILN